MATYMYQTEVSHKGLNKYQVIKARSLRELKMKKSALEAQWEEQWKRKCESDALKAQREALREAREAKRLNEEAAVLQAKKETEKAEKMQNSIDKFLLKWLSPKKLNPDKLKDFSAYSVSKPTKPKATALPKEPQNTDKKYNSKPSLFIRFSEKKLKEFKDKLTVQFEQDKIDWKKNKDIIEKNNEKIFSDYNTSLKKWEDEERNFKNLQEEENKKIDVMLEGFKNGEKDAVEFYFSSVLDNFKYPFDFDFLYELEYNLQTKTMIVDLVLPTVEDLPNLKSVTYVKSRSEFKESFFTEAYMKKLYDNFIYQVVLVILNHVFTLSKECNSVTAAVVNGKINTIDRATGKQIEPYILSINIRRDDFEGLSLENIDPKAWFKSAKGVSAATLAMVTPVAPVITMSKDDDRFIEGYNVSEHLDESVNLAAIDWQDFENLIREIFEKEFNDSGGEVKITQASRDGGVDAVAFDPDPIRGGKIVIQAKRYTNVVGVSAVRDLYGTVMNEGATKGILVTTSNYGNDAYSFAQGKPLTLLNGANLLHLLQKHGYKAKIDLNEAKRILQNQ